MARVRTELGRISRYLSAVPRLRPERNQVSILGDRAAAAFVLVLLVVVTLSNDDRPIEGSPRDFDRYALALVVAAGAVVLLMRRRFPGTTVLLTMGLGVVWYSNRYTHGIINAPILVAFYQLGTTGDRRRQIAAGGLALLAPVVGILVIDHNQVTETFDAVGWPLTALVLGEVVRNRRLLLAEYRHRAGVTEAEVARDAERRVVDERLQVARDVHDVLAHAVAVMTVQAGVAADAQGRDPEAVTAALAAVRAAGKEAMFEMRNTVAVLRDPDGARDFAPAPGIDRLPELVDGARAEGLVVELCLEPTLPVEPTRLARADGRDASLDGVERLVQLTAYRVVQESLTNVIRHAHNASRATISVQRQPRALVVAVADDGQRRAGHPFWYWSVVGYGLRGMRERVESLGGTIRFGWGSAGGWEVVASIPLRLPAGADAEKDGEQGP